MSEGELPLIECRGDPRAMGIAQGRVYRSAVRGFATQAGVRSKGRSPFSLRPLIEGPALGAGAGLEIVRHYPHLSERIQGLARGAGLPIDAVMELCTRAGSGALPSEPLCAEAAVVVHAEPGGPWLWRSLGAGVANGSTWIVRRSAPEVGFASVELTLPWLATAVGGVNEAGVAVALAPLKVPSRSALPPAMLLVQECLQRFESLAACIDWALKRPVGGDACIVVADASRDFAAIQIRGAERRVLRPAEEGGGGNWVVGGCQARHPALAKPGAKTPAEAAARAPAGERWLFALEPRERRLRLRSLDAAARETVLSVT